MVRPCSNDTCVCPLPLLLAHIYATIRTTRTRQTFGPSNVHAFKDGENRIVPNGRGIGHQRPLVFVLVRTRVLACYLGKSNEGEGEDSKCNKTSHSLRSTYEWSDNVAFGRRSFALKVLHEPDPVMGLF
jgi:hypothetical protein